ncbi:hypothetical protein [uncultured Comamonas sp.]|uniref:hypothetical protein n=1 Tax=uncultured Comamonas sp. TaxID=114710 RepID=UPI0025DB5C50|nr:hypothetical protein [uncultured Comamonas sp.]
MNTKKTPKEWICQEQVPAGAPLRVRPGQRDIVFGWLAPGVGMGSRTAQAFPDAMGTSLPTSTKPAKSIADSAFLYCFLTVLYLNISQFRRWQPATQMTRRTYRACGHEYKGRVAPALF